MQFTVFHYHCNSLSIKFYYNYIDWEWQNLFLYNYYFAYFYFVGEIIAQQVFFLLLYTSQLENYLNFRFIQSEVFMFSYAIEINFHHDFLLSLKMIS